MTDTGETFTAEERAAMKQRSREVRARRKRTTPEEDRAEVLAVIAALGDDERVVAERVHAIVSEAAPTLAPRTWYGSPAWAQDGTVVVFFQPGSKFGVRYSTLASAMPRLWTTGACGPPPTRSPR